MAMTLAELHEEMKSLRDELARLQSTLVRQYWVTLEPLQPQSYLGQPVTIAAQVLDWQKGEPVVHVPVTFVTAWGRLRTVSDYQTYQGTAVTTFTGVDGSARASLLTPTSEELSEEQENALAAMLGLLNPEAIMPLELEATFIEMARDYEWEPNIRFREAVDIYFRDFRHQLTDTVNYADPMASWSYLNAHVIAFAHMEYTEARRPGSSILGAATLPLQFKNWLKPWLHTYLNLSASAKKLREDLRKLKKQTQRTGELLQGVYDLARKFIAEQRGQVGNYVGQKISEAVILDFLDSGITDLPADTRVSLFQPLQVASQIVATINGQTLSGIVQAREDIRQAMNTHLHKLEQALELKQDAGAFQEFREQAQSALAGKVEKVAFQQFQSKMNAALGNKTDAAAFQDFQMQVSDSLGKKADRTELNLLKNEVQHIGSQLALKANKSELASALEGKVEAEAFAEFQRKFSDFQANVENSLKNKVSLITFQESLNNLTRNLADLNSKVSGLIRTVDDKADKSELHRALEQKVDSDIFAAFQEQTTELLRNKVSVNDFSKFRDNVNTRLRIR